MTQQEKDALIEKYANMYYNHEVVRLQDAISELIDELTKDEWISVKDRLPETDDFVLIWFNKFGFNRPLENGCAAQAGYNNLTGKWEDWSSSDIETNPDYMIVTHWRPLPQTPNT